MVRVLAVGLVAVAFAVATTAGGTAATDRSVLRVVSHEPVTSLDPALVTSHSGLALLGATCAKLFDVPDSRGPRPELAVALPRISSDRRTFTFRVKPGARFSDGSPITGASFERAIARVRDARMRSPWSVFVADVSGVSARGQTLVVRLRRSVGDLVSRLAMPWACPVPVDMPVHPEGIDAIPGSGPYAVASQTSGRETVLRRNQFYRGPRLRRPESIVFTTAGTATSNAEDVERGRYDYVQYVWLPSPPSALVEALAGRHGVNRDRFFARPSLGTVYLALNTARPLFRSNPRLRQAVNFALDRGRIVREGGTRAGQSADQLLPPGMPGFVGARLYPLDGPAIARARQLAAGHLRSRVAILYVGDEPLSLRRAEIVRSSLRQIGLTVRVRKFPRPILAARAARRGEPFDLVLTGWHAHYPDPAEFLVSLLDGPIRLRDNLNLSYFRGASSRIAAAHRMPAPARYRRLGRLETEIMARQAPVAPLFHPFSYFLVSERVRCFSVRMFGPDYGSFCVT